jgi:RimJ/RimL family protein N-acetyltransferase
LPGQGVSGHDVGVETVSIRTGNSLLRPWHARDADAVCRACQDPELHRRLTGLPWPYRISDAAAFVGERAPRLMAEGTALQLGVFTGDELAGSVALSTIDRGADTASLGYWTAPWARGRRVAERAARALLQWAFGAGLGLTRVDWRATVGNHPSRLTALRLGFTMIGEQPGAGPESPDKWLAALLPGDLTAAGTDVPDPVRRSARTFAGAHPTLPAGVVTLRPPARRDIAGIVECRSNPETARWFGVPRRPGGRRGRFRGRAALARARLRGRRGAGDLPLGLRRPGPEPDRVARRGGQRCISAGGGEGRLHGRRSVAAGPADRWWTAGLLGGLAGGR